MLQEEGKRWYVRFFFVFAFYVSVSYLFCRLSSYIGHGFMIYANFPFDIIFYPTAGPSFIDNSIAYSLGVILVKAEDGRISVVFCRGWAKNRASFFPADLSSLGYECKQCSP